MYLRILHLAASTLESEVEVALLFLLEEGKAITVDAVKALSPREPERSSALEMKAPEVNLSEYDALLKKGVA